MTGKRRPVAWTGSFEALPLNRDPQNPTVRSLTPAELAVVFQPIVDVERRLVFAHEALVRCAVPALSPPPVLLEAAVKERFAGRLGRMIRDRLFEVAAGPVFVNIHPEELSSRWLVRPDDPVYLYDEPLFLEITESATFTHFELCMDVLKDVCARARAVIVVDDFGAGYSNLRRIVDLAPAYVKLDRSLIEHLDGSPRKRTLVRHLSRLIADQGAEVVAEGIETTQELAVVRECGIRYCQGYLLARPAFPMPAVRWPS